MELVNDNFTELRGEIGGPADTPYEGGNFVLEIKIPETYPFNPPKVSFKLCLKIVLSSFVLSWSILTINLNLNFEQLEETK